MINRMKHTAATYQRIPTTHAGLWLCIGVLASLCAPHAHAAQHLPPVFSAEYSLHALGATVGLTQWRAHDDQGVRVFEANTEPSGLYALIRSETIHERSRLRIDGKALIPLLYRYQRRGGKRARFVEVEFNWATKRVRNTAKGQSWEMQVPLGTLDKFSYLLALMRDLELGKTSLQYDIADGGHLKRYDIEILAREVVETPLGALEAVKVRRKNRKSRTTTLWCATQLHHLPVKIEHSEKDGTTVSLKIQKVEGLPVR
jgi:hypothetical protein